MRLVMVKHEAMRHSNKIGALSNINSPIMALNLLPKNRRRLPIRMKPIPPNSISPHTTNATPNPDPGLTHPK